MNKQKLLKIEMDLDDFASMCIITETFLASCPDDTPNKAGAVRLLERLDIVGETASLNALQCVKFQLLNSEVAYFREICKLYNGFLEENPFLRVPGFDGLMIERIMSRLTLAARQA